METRRKAEDDGMVVAPEIELPPEPPLRARKKGRFGGMGIEGGFVQMVIVAVAVSLVVFVGMGMFGGGNLVSKADFTRNLSSVGTVLEQMRTDVNSAIQGIPNQVGQANAQVNSHISSLKERVSALEAQVANYKKRIEDLEQKISKMSPR